MKLTVRRYRIGARTSTPYENARDAVKNLSLAEFLHECGRGLEGKHVMTPLFRDNPANVFEQNEEVHRVCG